MKEILFRAKRLDNGEWVYGYIRHYQNNQHTTEKWTIYEPALSLEYEVDPATIGQYTGLTDKNGTKIFEGDILKVFYYGKSKIFGVVKFGKTRFFIDDNFMGMGDYMKTPMNEMFSRYEFEVVGNVHDNPELWKGGEK
ncbi:MAG: YopX family protein [Bacteroidales bacterium]|nr:YopX family protein [Bacteroidales bacterium]